MNSAVRQQILISGVGGQGVLFVTRLLAEAAIARGLAVFTCETHGMAQRGGTVVSHLKVGDFHSPLIRAGQADGLIVLKSENIAQHGVFLKSGGWVVANAGAGEKFDLAGSLFCVDADRLAQETANVKSLNLVVLGFALSVAEKRGKGEAGMFCTLADIEKVLETSFKQKGQQVSVFLKAIQAGYEAHGDRKPRGA
jgi:indolepyruvate ferredoxin oxidoreductase, beta subunit